jgi:hypothetical protein
MLCPMDRTLHVFFVKMVAKELITISILIESITIEIILRFELT